MNDYSSNDTTPERLRITRPWEFGVCKRCLANDTHAGDVIVRVNNRGWWHDGCYRIANPRFYDGLDAPAGDRPAPVTTSTATV